MINFQHWFIPEPMEAAKKDLETTENPIQAIAERPGYNNAYNFTRTFRSTFGISPSEYRKRMLGEYSCFLFNSFIQIVS